MNRKLQVFRGDQNRLIHVLQGSLKQINGSPNLHTVGGFISWFIPSVPRGEQTPRQSWEDNG
jgi:hypothetical protein